MNKIEEKLLANIPQSDSFVTVSNLFKLLDDPSRLEIFWILCHMEACNLQLATILNISGPAVSHHIKLLKDSDLLIARKDGKEVYYRVSDSDICQLLHLTIEKVMASVCPMLEVADHPSSDPVDAYIAEIHDYLLCNLHKRITIDTLSRKFSMNPTTLKLKFKQAYGHSIAHHIKVHRMEKAGELLAISPLSVQEISTQVGYASQSKFSAAFADTYGISPLEYRKKFKNPYRKNGF